MKTTLHLIAFTLALNLHAAAQRPVPLRLTIPAPPTGVQKEAFLGSSVAVDGGYMVAGAPDDDVGGQDSGVVKVFDSKTGALLFTLLNPNPANGAKFGAAVAISGSMLVVGAYNDSTGAVAAGSAFVYDLGSATPGHPVFTVNNPTPSAYGRFGWSVAISGARLVVGALGEDTGATDAGTAYVYELGSATPAIPALTLNNPEPGAGDYFGGAVAVSGSRVVVGAAGDDTGASNAGSVYAYDLGSTTPAVPIARLTKPSPSANDDFGSHLSISGTRVVVGDIWDDTGATNAGSAYVYDLAGRTPGVAAFILHNPYPAESDYFGGAVAISGARVVVGAYLNDTGALNDGSAYVFDLGSATPAVPVRILNNPEPARGDLFGGSVAISGTLVAVGVPYADMGATDAGGAYIFEMDSAAPVRVLSEPGPGAGDYFGSAVSISGSRFVVGAPFDDTGRTDSGRAYVFDRLSRTPAVPVFTLENPSPSARDLFGNSVAISGARVVVAAQYDDTGAAEAGIAYVFDLRSRTPTVSVLTLPNPAPVTGDIFGSAVAISGARVVVGAYGKYTPTDVRGAAYVFDLRSATPAVPVATLYNPHPSGGYFGIAVAISGARVVVGAQVDGGSGSAFVFDLESATPEVPIATLRKPGAAAGDTFGGSVAISGVRVVVGATGDDTGGGNAGSASVFNLGSSTPAIPTVVLHHPAPSAGDYFGSSVAISGTRIVIGAGGDDAGAGSAFVFEMDSANPAVPVATLHHPDPAAGDQFGTSVGIDGGTVIAGAPFDDLVMSDKGAAYLFDTAPDTKILTAPDEATRATNATFTFEGIDELLPAGALLFQASFDGAPFAPAISPLAFSALVDGLHMFAVRAIDSAGNVDATPAAFAWRVDSVPPETTITAGPGGTVNSRKATFTFTSNETDATFFASLDGAAEVAVTSPATYLHLAVGPHTFSVRAVDSAGNSDPTPATRAWSATSDPLHEARSTAGRAVPGAGGGGIPADAVWTSFGVPAINDSGAVAFLGKWKSATGSGAGIFVNDTLIARKGGAEKFETFKDPVLDAAGHAAFLATLDGARRDDDSVLVTNAFGALEIVAREGAATAEPDASVLDRIESISLVDGEILFTAKLRGGSPAVTSANNAAAFRIGNGGSTQRVVREGDALGATTVRSFKLLTAVPGSPGQNRAHAAGVATFLALFADRTQAVVEHARGSLSIRESEFQNYGAIAAAASNLAFLATRDGGVKSVFLGDAESIGPVAQIGQTTGLGATKFAAFQDPVLAPGTTQVAFPATLRGTTRAQDATLWWQPAAGPLALLAREGAPPPEVPAGARWDDFKSLAFPGGNTGPIFLATMQRGAGGVHEGNDTGVWAVDSEGGLRLLFRGGGTVAGGIVKTIAVLNAAPGSPGVTRSFNHNAQVAWRATFTDHGSAIVVTQVP